MFALVLPSETDNNIKDMDMNPIVRVNIQYIAYHSNHIATGLISRSYYIPSINLLF